MNFQITYSYIAIRALRAGRVNKCVSKDQNICGAGRVSACVLAKAYWGAQCPFIVTMYFSIVPKHN